MENIFAYGLIATVLVAVLIQGIIIIRKDGASTTLLDKVAETAKVVGNNPVFIENAKAAGANVPQEAYIALVERFNSLELLTAQFPMLVKALQAVEDVVLKIDHDLSNDPLEFAEEEEDGDKETSASPYDTPVFVKLTPTELLREGMTAQPVDESLNSG